MYVCIKHEMYMLIKVFVSLKLLTAVAFSTTNYKSFSVLLLLIVLSHNSVWPDFILCVDITILGMQHSVILAAQPYGLGLDETLLPQHLQKLGYATHAVGKVSGVKPYLFN